jgi:superfamily II DNA or RNA helicase
MRTVPVRVDSHLRVDGNLIGHDLAEQIFSELTIHNTAKDIARRTRRWEWEKLPDEFQLGDLDGDTVVMPRGYAVQLKLLLREHGIQVHWNDHRRWARNQAPLGNGSFPYRPHQADAVREIIRNQQGVYEAPTGSGKTVTCIGFLTEKNPARTLILVDQKGLLHQWRAEIARWLHVDPMSIGQIGDGQWNEGRRITVGTVQTIHRRKPENEFWWNAWDCVIVDECHHVAAQTIQDIVGSFTAKYRFGVSATPDRKNDKFEFVLNVLGEVFHRDDESALRDSGVLMRPTVKVVKTDFSYFYWPDHESDDDDECMIPGCRLNGKRPHFHQNNYGKMKNKLVHDPARNSLVAETMAGELYQRHHHLIVSDEVQHLMELMSAVEATLPSVPIYLMTGGVKGKEREQIKRQYEQDGEAIMLATVAKEGLDIPCIDRIYLPFPVNNPTKVQQWIGRGTRMSGDKRDTLIFDFFDHNVDVFRKQFRSRRFKCYDKLDIEVKL